MFKEVSINLFFNLIVMFKCVMWGVMGKYVILVVDIV